MARRGEVGSGKARRLRWEQVWSDKAWYGGCGETWEGGVCWVGVRRGMAGRLRCGAIGCGLVWHGEAVK